MAQSFESGSESRQRAAALFDNGQSAQERGDLAGAVRIYTEAIKTDPTIFQIYYQRGVALVALNRLTEAETDLRKVIQLEPGFARAYRSLGHVLLDQGKTAEATKTLARALELDDDLTGVRIYYASALIKSGDVAKAADELQTAIAHGEASAFAHALLGVAQERLGKTAEALASYDKAIELNPKDATAREGRGRLFAARGDTAKAIEEYATAYVAQPSPDVALTLAELYRKAGRLLPAIQIYRQLVIEKPEAISLRAELIRLMNENGQPDEATRELESLIAKQPGNAELLVLAGDLSFKEKPEAAARYYQRAVEVAPTPRNLVQFGASLVRSKQFQEALPVLQSALAKEPNNYQAHANVATAFFELKQYAAAAAHFIWLIRARPENAVAYHFLAISFDRIGDCAQALKSYREFLKRGDPVVNKTELEDARIRVSLLEKLAKSGKCKSPTRSK